jgi:uncharacterized RDD family membrane protein YckC
LFCGTCGQRVDAAVTAGPGPDSGPPAGAADEVGAVGPGAGVVGAGGFPVGPAAGGPRPSGPAAGGTPTGPLADDAASPAPGRPGSGWSLGADVDDAVAPVWRRLVALLVDQLVAVVVGSAATLAVLPTLRSGGSPGALLVPGLLLLLVAAAQWFAEAFAGRTAGGALLGIRTVSARTGRAPGLWAVLVRSVVQGLGAVVAGIGTYVVAASGAWDEGPELRGWHDKAAGTLVLRARPRPAASAAPVDRAAADAAATAPAAGPAPAAGGAAAPAFGAQFAPARPGSGDGAPVPPATDPSGTGLPGTASEPSRPAEAPVLAPAAAPEPGLPDRTIPTVPVLGDLEHTRVSGWADERPAAASGGSARTVLVLESGETVEVTGPGLVGRRPAPGTDTWDHLVRVTDPEQSVSSTHLAFWPVDGGLEVMDRGSTNGTVLVDPAGTPWSLPPGQPARVAHGWTLVLGNRRIQVTAS